MCTSNALDRGYQIALALQRVATPSVTAIFPCVQLPIKVEVIHTPIKPTPRHQFILAHYLCPIDTRCGIIYWL